MYIYLYMYICICVNMCLCIFKKKYIYIYIHSLHIRRAAFTAVSPFDVQLPDKSPVVGSQLQTRPRAHVVTIQDAKSGWLGLAGF